MFLASLISPFFQTHPCLQGPSSVFTHEPPFTQNTHISESTCRFFQPFNTRIHDFSRITLNNPDSSIPKTSNKKKCSRPPYQTKTLAMQKAPPTLHLPYIHTSPSPSSNQSPHTYILLARRADHTQWQRQREKIKTNAKRPRQRSLLRIEKREKKTLHLFPCGPKTYRLLVHTDSPMII